MIELQNVTKVYQTKMGPHVVLQDVSLFVPARQSIGVLGINGAGKSTLLRVIGGVEMPTLGEVQRAGRVSWPIGFGGTFHGTLTGEENCRFAARIYSQDVKRVVEEAREFSEIGQYFYVPVRTYSSGMRARLAFGLSMAIDFDLYLVDEVTAVGDRFFRRKCARALGQRKKRASLLMVSHSMATLRQHCDRCAVLDRGMLSMYDSVDEAEREYVAAVARGKE